MAGIWTLLTICAAVFALVYGVAGNAAEALLASGTQSVTLLMTLLGPMTLWSGLMEILCETGDVQRLGRSLRRIGRPLFPGVTDEAAWNAMSLNLSANLLGLGNAATPAGIDAAKRLSSLGEPGMRALAMLLALDNAGLQLIPTTVITLRQAAGAKNPADIWGMTVMVSGAATVCSVLLMLGLNRRRNHE